MSNCYLCGRETSLWYKNQGRTMLRCNLCRFAWVEEGLKLNNAGIGIYEEDSASASFFLQDGNDAYYIGKPSLINAATKLDLVRRHRPSGARLLDVGAGFGHFVKIAQEDYDVLGVEISPVAIEWAANNLDVKLVRVGVEKLPGEVGTDFDAVTMWDVIEHVSDPRQTLLLVGKCLKPGGLLILSTPDFGSLAAKTLGRHWYYLDVIQHIFLFSRQSLGQLLKENGYDVLFWGCMGHSYNFDYIISRLNYFYGKFWPCRLLFRWLKNRSDAWRSKYITINTHDVLTVVAKLR